MEIEGTERCMIYVEKIFYRLHIILDRGRRKGKY
jgi:hypothetical protein